MPGEDGSPVRIADVVPLATLDELVFGGWDVYPDNVYEAARKAAVLEPTQLQALRPELERIRPMEAVFDPAYVPNLHGSHVKDVRGKAAQARALMDDIRGFMQANGCERAVMVWCASTEVYTQPSMVHQDIDAFEEGLENDDPAIAPSMIYAYAAIRCGVPFANGAPNLACQDRPDADEDDPRAGAAGARAGHQRLVIVEHPRQPRRLRARQPGQLPHQGGLQARCARGHPAPGPQPGPVRRHAPPGADQLLPAARGQQGKLGQH